MKELKLDFVIIVDDLVVLLPIYLFLTWINIDLYLFPRYVILDGSTAPLFILINFSNLWYWFHVFLIFSAVACKAFGVRFMKRERIMPLRRRPTKEILEQFREKTRLHFEGIVSTYGPAIRNVQHPFDYFMDGLFRKFAPVERKEALATYVRTNSTLGLRLEQADKFYNPFDPDDEVKQLMTEACDEIFDELVHLKEWDRFADRVNFSVCGAFDDLSIDWTAAAGYPYQSGVKRGDVYHEACDLARNFLKDDDGFMKYMIDHVWYTTGRAKLQAVGAKLSARIICYPGYVSMLIGALYFQPFQALLQCFKWCAVGMTWTSGGARKFAEFFDDDEGVAPEGFRYCSLDVQGWDRSMHSHLLHLIKAFHIRVQHEAAINVGYIARFSSIFHDMINAVLTFPLGYAFRTDCGMKSGWPNTSHDDTLGHEIVVRVVEKLLQVQLKRQLYADDNFFLLPDDIDMLKIADAYRRCGMTIKAHRTSRYLNEVDFLSKEIHYIDGEYYVMRETVETMSRLIMPEENDPRNREVPDEIVAAERLIGHLLDNPFNLTVRTRIYKCLEHLRDHYRIYDVDISDRMKRIYRWRNIDLSRVQNVPIIPSMTFINELYGVVPVGLETVWPKVMSSMLPFNYLNQARSFEPFNDANAYCREIYWRIYSLGKKRRPVCVKYTSPFASPINARGFHGARFEFAVRHFGIQYTNVLDFGCHPGACAFSMLKHRNVHVHGVSLIPSKDKRICPYVLKCNEFKHTISDADDFKIDRRYDLIHDDVDAVETRNQMTDIDNAKRALRRFIKMSGNTKTALMTIHDISADVKELIYSCYRMFGEFDIVKPLYSNPWKCEFMLCFKKSTRPIVKKTIFLRALNYYLNQYNVTMCQWADMFAMNIKLMEEGKGAIKCPIQDNAQFQQECEEKLFEV